MKNIKLYEDIDWDWDFEEEPLKWILISDIINESNYKSFIGKGSYD